MCVIFKLSQELGPKIKKELGLISSLSCFSSAMTVEDGKATRWKEPGFLNPKWKAALLNICTGQVQETVV